MFCAVPCKCGKTSVLDTGWDGRGKNRKGRGTGKANDCSVFEHCIYMKATCRTAAHFELSSVLAVVSPATLVGCSVG